MLSSIRLLGIVSFPFRGGDFCCLGVSVSMAPLEISKAMHRIQEERSSAMESATNRVQQAFSADSDKLRSCPTININNNKITPLTSFHCLLAFD
jgi:hypothetical protein